VMYHFDLFDDEAKNVGIVHLALLYIQRAHQLFLDNVISDVNVFFEILRLQTVILKTCEDCFIETVAQFYKPHTRQASENEVTAASMLSARVLPYAQYSVIVEINDYFDGFRNNKFLEETCRDLESRFPSISPKLLKEAKNVRAMLFYYTLGKVTKKDLVF